MSIGAIGQSGFMSAASASNSTKNTQNTAGASIANTQSKKDSATISEAAKELAALKTGTTSQEESNEAASEKIQEQLSGLQ